VGRGSEQNKGKREREGEREKKCGKRKCIRLLTP